jgi:DNA-binding MarR family transcriptional regulator
VSAELRLEEFLPYRLNRLSEQASAGLARVYATRFRLTVPQWRILATLSECPGLSATAITARCNLDKVKVSRAVADLEARGLVVRRASADDARSSELRLTAGGARLFANIAPLALEWQQRLLEGLSAAERRGLERLLTRLEDRVAVLAGQDAAERAPESGEE